MNQNQPWTIPALRAELDKVQASYRRALRVLVLVALAWLAAMATLIVKEMR